MSRYPVDLPFKPMTDQEIENVESWDHGSEYARDHIKACQDEIQRLHEMYVPGVYKTTALRLQRELDDSQRDCREYADSFDRSQKLLHETISKLDEYLANHDKAICVWCGYVGPKAGDDMLNHALDKCTNNPLGVLLKLKDKVEPLWVQHSKPDGDGRMAIDPEGFLLAELLPSLREFPGVPPSKEML